MHGAGPHREQLTKSLPQGHCYVNVLRDAMAVDSLDDCGAYLGATGDAAPGGLYRYWRQGQAGGYLARVLIAEWRQP